MVFHVVALPHTEVTKEFVQCAYTQKVLNFARMMTERGHTVFVYGAGSKTDAPCTEFVSVYTTERRLEYFPDTDVQPAEAIQYDPQLPYWKEFNSKAVELIRERIVGDQDFLCLIYGKSQQPISDALKIKPVEYGVGYLGIITDSFRVFESAAWRNHVYGAYKQSVGSFLDTVIHNYYDPTEFGILPQKGHFFFIGRLVHNKGMDLAVKACEQTNQPLILAGQGPLKPEGKTSTYIGKVGVKERKQWMGSARGTFVLTRYIGPFEGVHAESMLCGVPVITTDFGVFPETVENGFNGYRINSMNDIYHAIENVDKLDRQAIRDFAIATFSLDAIVPQYERYFERLLASGYKHKSN